MIHFVYRSYGGENRKLRPSYYSKQLALVSFLRAVAGLDEAHEVIYLNDGPIQADRLEIMSRTGEIVACQNRRLAGSLSDALDLPARRGWDARDLVWFAEDDYLYLPEAFAGFAEAARRFATADYFALYATIGDRPPFDGRQPDFVLVPAGWRDSEPVSVRGHPWRRALSTTSTFGGRAGALREDRFVMELAIRSGGAFDQTTCLMCQGFQPFRWSAIVNPHDASISFGLRQKLRNAALRAGINLSQLGRKALGGTARLWVAAEPALSTHLETEYLARGTDWAAVARDCREWGIAQGMMAPVIDHAAIQNSVQDMVQEAAQSAAAFPDPAPAIE